MPVASAHAVLQSAQPAPNGHVDVGLTYVEVRFTEDVEREYTDADVALGLDSVRNGAVQFDQDAHNVIRVPVKPLGDGIYAVSWRTLSVDSHTARGVFLFSVGNATIKFADETAPHDHEEHTRASILQQGFARAVFYLGLFLALGVPLFALVVDRGREPESRLLVPAGVFALLGAAAAALLLALFAQRLDLPLGVALDTTAGRTIAWRGAFLALAALLLLAAPRAPAAARRNVLGIAVLAAGFALAATALGSHAAAATDARLLAVGADALHLLTGAVWVGGVFAFVLVGIRRGAREMAQLIVRFSPLAVACVGLLVMTGAYASLRHIPRVSALWTDWYGRLVVLKVLLLGPLVLLGAYNKLILGPSLARGTGKPAHFRGAVVVEALLMAGILTAAGVLASTPPPDRAVVEGDAGPQVLYLEGETSTTHVVLGVRPNPPVVGLQRLTVALHPLTTEAISNRTQVALKVGLANESEPGTLVDRILPQGPGQWTTEEDSFFTAPGHWRVWVIVQRPMTQSEDEYRKLTFDVNVSARGAT